MKNRRLKNAYITLLAINALLGITACGPTEAVNPQSQPQVHESSIECFKSSSRGESLLILKASFDSQEEKEKMDTELEDYCVNKQKGQVGLGGVNPIFTKQCEGVTRSTAKTGLSKEVTQTVKISAKMDLSFARLTKSFEDFCRDNNGTFSDL